MYLMKRGRAQSGLKSELECEILSVRLTHIFSCCHLTSCKLYVDSRSEKEDYDNEPVSDQLLVQVSVMVLVLVQVMAQVMVLVLVQDIA